jgi:hypothetical protein
MPKVVEVKARESFQWVNNTINKHNSIKTSNSNITCSIISTELLPEQVLQQVPVKELKLELPMSKAVRGPM